MPYNSSAAAALVRFLTAPVGVRARGLDKAFTSHDASAFQLKYLTTERGFEHSDVAVRELDGIRRVARPTRVASNVSTLWVLPSARNPEAMHFPLPHRRLPAYMSCLSALQLSKWATEQWPVCRAHIWQHIWQLVGASPRARLARPTTFANSRHSYPWRAVRSAQRAPNRCLVYSIGIANDFRFDDAMARTFGCEVHSFDPTRRFLQKHEAHNVSGVTFHPWGLRTELPASCVPIDASGLSSNFRNKWGKQYDPDGQQYQHEMYSLPQMMAKLGHVSRRLTVLKIDCEGCEWEVFNPRASAAVKILREQVDELMIEIHFGVIQSAHSLASFAAFYSTIAGSPLRAWYHHRNPCSRKMDAFSCRLDRDLKLVANLSDLGAERSISAVELGFTRTAQR